MNKKKNQDPDPVKEITAKIRGKSYARRTVSRQN